jgi:glycosyltransferase involved in cell wall biosynthesis
VLKNSKFEKRDNNTQQIVGKIEWNVDSEVLFEGANTEVYKPVKSTFELPNIKESFAYLFVGHWIGNGPIGEDRKNISLLVKGFYETFKNKNNPPALILKTSTVGSSYTDRDDIIKRIQAIKSTVKASKFPNVYLLHGEFSDTEMNEIYNHPKVKAMVNLTKGEGFGRPLLEFSLTNKPILTTGWSGHTDYLNPDFTTLLKGNLTQIHPSIANNMLLPDAEWFSADYSQVGHYLKDMFENYKNYVDKGKRQGYHSRTNFSFDKMKEKIDEILTIKVPKFPKQVQLQLPKLKKIELPKLTKIEQ